MYLIGMLVLLFLANLAMLMGMTNWPQRVREGFAATLVSGSGSGSGSGMVPASAMAPTKAVSSAATVQGEAFMDYLTGGGFGTESIGPYDGVNMAAQIPAAGQGFRARMPNVPLAGAPVELGPDNLFYFRNNQCKPECCGATLSCDGGCVCTTPEQRDFINRRGGNRTAGDGF